MNSETDEVKRSQISFDSMDFIPENTIDVLNTIGM